MSKFGSIEKARTVNSVVQESFYSTKGETTCPQLVAERKKNLNKSH